MNKNKILILRIIETILLFGIVFKWAISGDTLSMNFGVLSLGFNATIQSGVEDIIISTAALGFPFAFVATLLCKKELKGKLVIASLIISTLGIISYGNEIVRYATGGSFRFLFDLSFMLLVIDWILYRRYARVTSNTPEHSKEIESNHSE